MKKMTFTILIALSAGVAKAGEVSSRKSQLDISDALDGALVEQSKTATHFGSTRAEEEALERKAAHWNLKADKQVAQEQVVQDKEVSSEKK